MRRLALVSIFLLLSIECPAVAGCACHVGDDVAAYCPELGPAAGKAKLIITEFPQGQWPSCQLNYTGCTQYRIAYGPGNCGQHGPPSDPNQHFVRECYGTTFGTTLAFDCQTV